MLCHGKPLLCGKKATKNALLTDGNESEGEDMYGFLPQKKSISGTGSGPLRTSIRRENIYEASPRKSAVRKVVTFREEPPRVRLIQRRHSCAAENARGYAAAKYNYQPLIPVERLPSYPNSESVRRSASFVAQSITASVCGHYHRRPPLPPPMQAPAMGPEHPRPPCYHVAIRRAASFSASRGVNRNREWVVRRPPWPAATAPMEMTEPPSTPIPMPEPMPLLNRQISSSTSDLYVDSLALLKGGQPRDQSMSAASSTSSVSEATVYRKVGPCDYVSVSDKPGRKSFRSSMESSSDDGVDVSFRSSGGSSTDLEYVDPPRKNATDLSIQRTDTYRFSMATLEDTQDVDLDAILGELCALESQYKDVSNSSSRNSSNGSDISFYRRTVSNISPQSGAVARTESPDNDSAFSDSVSLFSSESSTSSSTTPSTHNNQIIRSEDSKAEKIKLALQKMKEANVKKLFVKVFDRDGSAKSLLVDENMKCGYVMKLLADKHHMPVSPKWGLVEHLPDLYMERVYEEHESLVENLMLWTRDSKNKLYFVERPERLLLFQRPEIFHPEYNSISTLEDELSQNSLVEEYLSSGGLPTIESPLYIKLDSKKGWKKYQAVLRASGLYYYKEKTIKSSKDLACLATFDVNQVYYGVGWKKKFKAPTEHCFAIKHPCLQQPKSTKYIKYLCAEDALTLHKWVTAIRIIKYGRQLLDNYQSQIIDDSELSDSGSSGCDVAFESDFPCGTIKRKPPKLPLTATTRQLASLDTRNSTAAMLERTPSFGSLPPPPPELLASTLTLNEEAVDVLLPPPPPPPRLLPPPSATFLQDLQRVMRRKWQVAQKCKQDLSTTPHEVLGFRDPPDYKETNVSNWVAEHYGGGQNLYENVYRSGAQPSPSGVTPARVPVVPIVTSSQSSSSASSTPVKKRPPPPPPPRAETTQLTTTMAPLARCPKY